MTNSERLDSFADLKPNWDGYGADAIQAEPIRRAKLIDLVLEWVGVKPVYVFPTVVGGVNIEFEHGAFEYEIELEPNGKTRLYRGITAHDVFEVVEV